ncbi:cytochrome c oxidase accessory protein CcoG [Salinarimonas soli]|uniref:Cytochrome c oxidase accessory protein CcoG n=1 Tax=Salinarimonas soli TaxID=1638099 RepID=A0A5B2V9C4_9HYPH|nr:cytochrome c oxidase accessory protein CcoG [Salinarimonas soli]KAA2236093.1 cytochrome c oxidase accessory protein CcoG [Salinarimonas soli]
MTAAAPDDVPLYESRKAIYPQAVRGRFRTIKWAIMALTLGVYYLLPFVRWNRGPGAPDQAVLLDFPGRRFYFFFIEIWPQEVTYIAGLLILAALALFLMNAVAGRIWCGYLCPQTVWTDLFMAVERVIQGDRRDRMRLDAAPWTPRKVGLKLATHAAWLVIAWWTGGAWVLYFADAPTLVWQLATVQAPLVAYAWIAILTGTTYLLAGHMREQVCTYMCPWPRIQAALTDEQALTITYRYDRGEPRGSVKKNAALKEAGEPAGDCVDCMACVFACPHEVDIRNGLQVDCIQCGLCIDACDTVMRRIGRPEGLIGYDTDVNVERRAAGLAPEPVRVVRPRTVLYAALIVGVGGLMTWSLLGRSSLAVSSVHDRNPVFVRLSDGTVRNAYTVRVMNKAHEERVLTLEVAGLAQAQIDAVGAEIAEAARLRVRVEPDQTRELRVLVTAPRGTTGSHDITFLVTDPAGSDRALAGDHFVGPKD